MRCAFLMTTVPGFFSACVEALAALPGMQVMMVCENPGSEAPFDPEEVTPSRVEMRAWETLPSSEEVLAAVEEFRPDVVVATGWQIRQFRHVAYRSAGKRLRVLMMDNQWLGTPKQYLGIATSKLYLHPFFDIAFLPGRNQEVFARKLGYPGKRIWRGAYCCDHPLFAGAAERAAGQQRRRAFMFVGRLVPAKAPEVLAAAYRQYRENAGAPWDLEVYGAGPLAGLFDPIPGVSIKGFYQPPALADAYATAGCFVLPSVFEPWGTVIHEAAACRLPVICTTACGAAPHLVEDGSSGYLVEPGDVNGLARALQRISELAPDELAAMGQVGGALARRYTPALWAANFRRRASETLGLAGPVIEPGG
jgi:glycosyltransferase involved in cell wall biosynthesis